jgi:hypothetical protein
MVGLKFKVKLSSSKKHIYRTFKPKKVSRLVIGKVIYVDDAYGVELHMDTYEYKPGEHKFKDVLILPFTKESYNIKGVKDVFSREKDEHNHYVHYIRSEFKAKIFPGDSSKLLPFALNVYVSGYICTLNDKPVFSFHKLIPVSKRKLKDEVYHTTGLEVSDDE